MPTLSAGIGQWLCLDIASRLASYKIPVPNRDSMCLITSKVATRMHVDTLCHSRLRQAGAGTAPPHC